MATVSPLHQTGVPDATEEYPKYLPDPVHCFNVNGKSTLDLSYPAIYNITEKQGLSDMDRLAFKQFELYRLMTRMERRDTIIMSFTTSELLNGSTLQHWLGTPFPVIEPQPHIMECMLSVRWYEHVTSVFIGIGYYLWLRTKPSTRWGFHWNVQKWLGLGAWFLSAYGWSYRASLRLTGQAPNDAECYKYGVLETPERLKEKADNWRQYAEYKEEWMRRFDYYVYGQRPGETFSLWSCLLIPYKPVRYCTKFDYPQRKNPYTLTQKPLSDVMMDWSLYSYYPPEANTMLSEKRPELRYMGRHMLDRNVETQN